MGLKPETAAGDRGSEVKAAGAARCAAEDALRRASADFVTTTRHIKKLQKIV